MPKLVFGKANAKLQWLEKHIGGKVYTFSLLSGANCPYARDCKSQAVSNNGKLRIQDGPVTKWRCFSASQEVLFPSVYKSRKHNTDTILPLAARSVTAAADLICSSLPKKFAAIRIHVGGDFSTRNYFKAWLEVARRNPGKIFYAYTKSLPFWVAELANIPSNMVLTASEGGHRDDLIAKHNLRSVRVVYSIPEAQQLGLEIDHDDSHAYSPELRNQSFALLIHGVQPAGSVAGKAVKALDGVGSYGRGAVAA